MPRLTSVNPAGVEVTPVRLGEAVAAGRTLTTRDHEVIALLGEHQVLTAEQIARVAFPNPVRARERLVQLARRGVLARFRHCQRPGSLPWRYTLGLLGAAIYAAETGAPLPRPHEVTEKIIRLHYSRTLDHRLGVNEFFTLLADYARRHDGCALAEWWSESKIGAACGTIVRPDAYGEWTETTPTGHASTVGFFLEYDTGTEQLKTLLGKIDKYAELASAGITRPILFHLPTARRHQNFRTALARGYGRTGPPVPVATTAADLTAPAPSSPAERVWLPADSDHRMRLIELATLTTRAARPATPAVGIGTSGRSVSADSSGWLDLDPPTIGTGMGSTEADRAA